MEPVASTALGRRLVLSYFFLIQTEYDLETWSGKARCVLTDLRIIPRLMVLGYGYMLYDITQWFMTLPAPETQQAALITTVYGAAAAIFGLYTNTGCK
jgi:hypothetical protein